MSTGLLAANKSQESWEAYVGFLRVLATATSQTSGSSDTLPPSASGKLSALWNRRATTGILGYCCLNQGIIAARTGYGAEKPMTIKSTAPITAASKPKALSLPSPDGTWYPRDSTMRARFMGVP